VVLPAEAEVVVGVVFLLGLLVLVLVGALVEHVAEAGVAVQLHLVPAR
jgi:hypothetical protein